MIDEKWLLTFHIHSFKSYYFERGLKFKLRYESSNVSQWSYNSGACGGNFSTPYGILTSPSYPESYPENADCTYTISQPTGTIIMMRILSMDIDYLSEHYDYINFNNFYDWQQYGGVSCSTYYLEIRDGASEESPLIDGYCGDSTIISLPIQLRSTQHNVWMRQGIQMTHCGI